MSAGFLLISLPSFHSAMSTSQEQFMLNGFPLISPTSFFLQQCQWHQNSFPWLVSCYHPSLSCSIMSMTPGSSCWLVSCWYHPSLSCSIVSMTQGNSCSLVSSFISFTIFSLSNVNDSAGLMLIPSNSFHSATSMTQEQLKLAGLPLIPPIACSFHSVMSMTPKQLSLTDFLLIPANSFYSAM